MDANEHQLTETVSVTVAAAPEAVYDLVADITRMGEWSPACTGGKWSDDERRAFLGANKRGDVEYETQCAVEVAERGREFTFVNRGVDGQDELVRWSYRFEPSAGGSEVTESWEVLPAMIAKIESGMDADAAAELFAGMKTTTQAGMAETLGKLKAAAEA